MGIHVLRPRDPHQCDEGPAEDLPRVRRGGGARNGHTRSTSWTPSSKMHRREELKIRTDVILGLPHRYMTIPELDAAISSYFGPKQHLGDDMLKLGGIRFVVVNDGWWAYSPEKLKFLIRAYNRWGWQMAFHINTGGAGEGEGNSTEMVISLLEEADKERTDRGAAHFLRARPWSRESRSLHARQEARHQHRRQSPCSSTTPRPAPCGCTRSWSRCASPR